MHEGGEVLSLLKSMNADKKVKGHERKSLRRAGQLDKGHASRITAIMSEQKITLPFAATKTLLHRQ